jgi:hypothetical protein
VFFCGKNIKKYYNRKEILRKTEELGK